jgi:hypothetical protein
MKLPSDVWGNKQISEKETYLSSNKLKLTIN